MECVVFTPDSFAFSVTTSMAQICAWVGLVGNTVFGSGFVGVTNAILLTLGYTSCDKVMARYLCWPLPSSEGMNAALQLSSLCAANWFHRRGGQGFVLW